MGIGSGLIIAIALLGAFALIYRFGRAQKAEADGPNGMLAGVLTARSRQFLLSYLLLLALALAIVLVALWSVEFPDARFLDKAPNLSAASGEPGHPRIQQLDPYELATGSAQSMLTVYGTNFSDKTKILINAVERQAQLVKPTTLLVPLLQADIAQAGALTVTVAEGETSSSHKLPVLPPARVLGTLKLAELHWQINEETRLVLLVLFAGALGSYVHAIKSLVDYIGNETAKESWFWFYISRPFVGMALAVIFYAVIRGGFLAGTPADAKSVNPFGVVALAGLVGMFADKASQKLAEVFDVMFRTPDTRRDKLSDLFIPTPTLRDAAALGDYQETLKAEGGQGGYTWSATGLPHDLHLNPASGVLAGKAPAAGEYAIKVTVKDRAGTSKDKDFRLVVKPAAASPAANPEGANPAAANPPAIHP